MKLLAANNAQTVLASGINASATTLSVASGAGAKFPAPVSGTSLFKLTLLDAATESLTEIMHVTVVSGDTFTVVRGQEGTTARSWSVNDIVANMVTAGTLDYFAQLDSPAFTGTPTAPTAAFGTNTTQLATMAAVYAATQAFGLGATISPTVTTVDGITQGGNYVISSALATASGLPLSVGHTITHIAGSTTVSGMHQFASPITSVTANKNRVWHRQAFSSTWSAWQEITYTDSPTFTGVPAAPTAAAGTNTTQIATTAFVTSAVSTAAYGRYSSIQTFSSVGTYTPTTGTKKAIAIMIGGGGGGGGCPSTGAGQQACANGGQSGSYLEISFDVSAASYAITVGSGGSRGTASSVSGGAGGTTSIAGIASCPGGPGGNGGAAGSAITLGNIGSTSGLPTVTSGVTIKAKASEVGEPFTVVGTASQQGRGGRGGSSPFGVGGQPGVSGPGIAGSGNGTGGGGCSQYASNAGDVGGVGTSGIIVILEFQ